MEDKERQLRFSTSWAAKRFRVFAVWQLLWFCLVYPVVPSSLPGFLIEFAAGVFLFVVLFGLSRGIVWLSMQPTRVSVFRTLAVLLVLIVGIVLFATTYEFRGQFSTGSPHFRVCSPLSTCWHSS